jgi:transcriptional regulator with XRE-family HTH domain
MSTIVTGPEPAPLDARLAARVLTEREQRGWSVAELAAKSGVSRAMISKIERGDASPTASLLVKIAAAFGLPLSLLLARAEGEASRISRADDQQRWQDPESGYRRRAISPPSDGLLQLTEVELPAGARLSFPAAAYTFIHQQLWILDGTLTFHEGSTIHQLGPGDCLSLGPPVDHTFENRTRRLCRYLVIVVRR